MAGQYPNGIDRVGGVQIHKMRNANRSLINWQRTTYEAGACRVFKGKWDERLRMFASYVQPAKAQWIDSLKINETEIKKYGNKICQRCKWQYSRKN